MTISARKLAGGIIAGTALLAAWALPAAAAAACRAGQEAWFEIALYLGRNIGGGGEVSERQFRRFLAEIVTPRFPDGLSVIDVAGQFRSGNQLIREQTKLLIILVPDAAAVAGKVNSIVDRYKTRFSQESVLHTETEVCLSFD